MSGGSYNHLCYKDVEELFCQRHVLRKMADALEEFSPSAARETEEMLAYISHALRMVEVRQRRLAPLWKAIEWHEDNDISLSSLVNAVSEYEEYENE